jgi:CBS domain-containing protein
MRAHQIMTKYVVTVTPQTSIEDAANIMLRNHISGLPVVEADGKLVGIVSESDFLRRSEIGTGRKRAAWLQFLLGPGRAATDFVRERGRKVEDVMTTDPVTVEEETPLEDLVALMEKKGIKRLPVVKGNALVGIVTRSNLLQAVASMARDIPDPTADDDHIRNRILREVNATDWRPIGFEVNVRNGIVHLHGIITNDNSRQATIVAAENVAGVKKVHDHLCFVDTYSGFYVESPEDMKAAS